MNNQRFERLFNALLAMKAHLIKEAFAHGKLDDAHIIARKSQPLFRIAYRAPFL